MALQSQVTTPVTKGVPRRMRVSSPPRRLLRGQIAHEGPTVRPRALASVRATCVRRTETKYGPRGDAQPGGPPRSRGTEPGRPVRLRDENVVPLGRRVPVIRGPGSGIGRTRSAGELREGPLPRPTLSGLSGPTGQSPPTK